ncbi:hypothetical protein SFR_6877 [Streptomyces sp. FR-008]|nr:hypothetical protein SFR_6877 [Streptomyces sp. FR-008]
MSASARAWPAARRRSPAAVLPQCRHPELVPVRTEVKVGATPWAPLRQRQFQATFAPG